jgi:hypothetical protein
MDSAMFLNGLIQALAKKAHEFHRGNHHPKPSVEVEFPDCDKEDAETLGRLMEAVNKREFTRV